MVDKSDWQKMKQHAFDAFAKDGKMSAHELAAIVEIGCADGKFDEHELAVLINIISNLTRADMDDAMWAKVDDLIHRFALEADSEAKIERLEDEHDPQG